MLHDLIWFVAGFAVAWAMVAAIVGIVDYFDATSDDARGAHP